MSDIYDYNPNTVWIVDGRHYITKVEAMLASVKNNNSKIQFYYYDKEFKAFDWTVEPDESWNDLCRQRAQQLRDSNKYIRLWYSGGADSHTMLRAFLNNNIHLDEIVMVRASPIDNFDSATNRETNQRSMPHIDSIRLDIPDTKISIVSMSAKHYEDYYNSDDWFLRTMGVYHFADDPGVLLDSRLNLEKYGGLTIPDGCVEIVGNLKPSVIRHEEKYYFGIVDSSFHYLHWANVREFYTTAEMPKLQSKQCHQLKHVIQQWYPNGNVSEQIYKPDLIDPLFEIAWYNCSRTILDLKTDYGKSWHLFSPKTLLRINDAKQHNPRLLSLFMEPLKELQKNVSHHWPDFNVAMYNIRSHWYCLGPYQPANI